MILLHLPSGKSAVCDDVYRPFEMNKSNANSFFFFSMRTDFFVCINSDHIHGLYIYLQ